MDWLGYLLANYTSERSTSTRSQTVVSWLAADTTQRLLLSGGVVVFALEVLFLLAIPPATGFENSIVAAYPVAFWACFATVLTASVLVFVGTTVTYSRNWQYALGLLAANYGVFFFLPVHRGYALYGRGTSDVLAHLGYARELLQTGVLPEVVYPAEHTLISTLAMHGVSLPMARYIFQFGFTLLFICSVGVLVREFSGDRRGLPAGLAAATPLILMNYQVQIHPAILSVMLFPVMIYLLEQNRRVDLVRFRVVYVALALLIAFFHPITTVFLVVLLLSSQLLQFVSRRYALTSEGGAGGGTGVASNLTWLAGLLLVVEAVWLKGFHRTEMALRDLLGSGGGTSVVEAQVDLASEAGLSLPVLLLRFAQKYGPILLYIGIAGLFGLLVLRRLSRRETSYTSLFVVLQAAIGVCVALLFLNFDFLERNPVRVSRYATVIAVVAVGLVLYHASSRADVRGNSVVSGLTVVLVVAAIGASFAGLTYWPNKQMTHAEHQGAEFTLESHDRDDAIRSSSLTVKTQLYISGERREPGDAPAFLSERAGHGLPPGIGYEENATVNETFENGTYIVTQAYDRKFDEAGYYTPEQRRGLGVYETRHLRQLENDRTANKLYANGGFGLWKTTDRNTSSTAIAE